MNNLKYITFDELMASVESDMANYAKNNMINRGNYIKVVRKVNHDLGLKIFGNKEKVLTITDHKADLPEDFMYLQMALGLGEVYLYTGPSIFGTHTVERETPVIPVCEDKVTLESSECGTTYWVTQMFKDKVVKHNHIFPLAISNKSIKLCSENCLNLEWSKFAGHQIHVENGQVVTSFREGKVYINYLSDLVDEDNNVLLLDHPKVIPYYEYAVKKSILENILIDGSDDVERRWGLIKNELREARIEALNFVNTTEYKQIQDIFKINRNRFINRYQTMFYA